jgi:hypothetical protein
MKRFLQLASLLAALGCGGSSYYLHPRADLGAIRKVAVLPFETVTPERVAAEKVQKIFLNELLAADAFEVVEPGVVLKALRDERIDNVGALTPADIVRVSKAMGAQGLFFGTVVDYADPRGGETIAPDITIQLRLVESQTGATVWSASRTRNGTTMSARLFGFGGNSSTEVARSLIRDELSTLLR